MFPDVYPYVPPRISRPWVDGKPTDLGIARINLAGQFN